jgi:hypothetical protein
VNDLVYTGRWKEALRQLHSTNNFPEFTGRICPAPCEAACVLGINEPAVTIKQIEKNIVERGWAEGLIHPELPKFRSGKKIAIMAGRGALGAGEELETLADLLAAPIVKPLLGKACVPDHSPYTTGGIGLLGTAPSQDALEECDTLLIVGINQSIDQLRNKVRELNGFFIPAHVDRQRFGIISQLGFIPDDLDPDAIEILDSQDSFRRIYPGLHPYRKIKNSDAHHPNQIGSSYSLFKMEQISFTEIAYALRGEKGREVLVA